MASIWSFTPSSTNITTAAAAIERGEYDVMIAGGSDSVSNAAVNLPQKLVQAAAPLALGKPSPRAYLDAAIGLEPFTGLLPSRPRIEERTTGEVMGESAEKMARIHGVTREAQDAFAARSHARAAAAIASGRFDREVVPVTTPDGKTVTRDGLVRENTGVEKLAGLKPAFERDGTVTAGNASPLTDGAAAVLIMSEEKANELGLTPRARFHSFAVVGDDPLLMAMAARAILYRRAYRVGPANDDHLLIVVHARDDAPVIAFEPARIAPPDKGYGAQQMMAANFDHG